MPTNFHWPQSLLSEDGKKPSVPDDVILSAAENRQTDIILLFQNPSHCEPSEINLPYSLASSRSTERTVISTPSKSNGLSMSLGFINFIAHPHNKKWIALLFLVPLLHLEALY
jgi:hypothetical protein